MSGRPFRYGTSAEELEFRFLKEKAGMVGMQGACAYEQTVLAGF